MPLLLLKYWKYIAVVLAAFAAVGYWQICMNSAYDKGKAEANTACLVNAVNDAEAARNEVERVRNEVEAEAKSREQERQRKYDEDQQRRDREQADRDNKLRDWLSLKHTATPQCQDWRKQAYLCKPE